MIFHFGDHDPSGIDMTRDIRDRLELFTGSAIGIRRIALNMDQIDEYAPPPNPAKITDSRAEAYIAKFGDESWELDALEPRTIVELVEDSIQNIIDMEAWEEACETEKDARHQLASVAEELRAA